MKFNINIKINLAFLLVLIILAVLWTGKYNIYEGYYSRADGRQDSEPQYITDQRRRDKEASDEGIRRANKYEKRASDRVEYIGGKVSSVLSTIASAIAIKEPVLPQWRQVYGDGISVPDTVTTGLKPDTSLILTSGCSTKSILKSDYANDFCKISKGDFPTIDEKCKALSKENCNLPSCCILLNGTKCVSGDANGPTYLTDQGNAIDYYYYLHRNQCYGKGCEDATNQYQKECGKYGDNSTGISKGCMIQMFNKAGCSNPSPDYIINDDYVYNNSKTSKKFIENDLKATAKTLISGISKNDEDSRVKCKGDPNNPCDKFLSDSMGISKACMIKTYNDAGCRNRAPPLITNQYVADMNGYSKTVVLKGISEVATSLKIAADSDPRQNSEATASIPLCYGSGVTVSPNAKAVASTAAPVPQKMFNDATGPSKCLDILNDGKKNKIVMKKCKADTAGQQWLKVPNQNYKDTYFFQNNLSGSNMCLDILNDGTNKYLIMTPCGRVTGQQWSYTANSEGKNALTNNFTGPKKCVDILSDDGGDRVLMNDCAPKPGQSWHMQ